MKLTGAQIGIEALLELGYPSGIILNVYDALFAIESWNY